MKHQYEGVIVRQKAIDWWPYLEFIVDRINEACETMDSVLLSDIFLDAARLLCKTRRDRTVNTMKSDIQRTMRYYKNRVQKIVIMKKRLEGRNHVGKSGKPLAAATLQNYRYAVKNWPKERERLKNRIREDVREIKIFSSENRKVITRGKVSLQLIHGGKYPVWIEQRYKESGWQRVR